jgi:hypothetical protein
LFLMNQYKTQLINSIKDLRNNNLKTLFKN